MPIEIQCGDCGKKYRVDDRLAGKRGKCKNCGNLIAVPGTPVQAASPAPAAPRGPAPAARPAPAPARQPVQRHTAQQAMPAEPDPLEALAAMERAAPAEDPGMVPLAPPAMPSYPAPGYPAPMGQPMMMPQGAPMPGPMMGGPMPGRRQQWVKPKSRASASGSSTSLLTMAPLILLGLAVVLVMLSFLVKSIAPFALIVLGVVGFGVLATGGIMGLIVSFRESAVCGLMYLFVPFYRLYYLISRWYDMKRPFLLQVCGFAIMGGAVAVALAGAGGFSDNAARVKCSANLRSISQACLIYSNDHKGQFPMTLGDLVVYADAEPEMFVCPTNVSKIPADMRRESRARVASGEQFNVNKKAGDWVNANSDYILLTPGAIVGRIVPGTILVQEKPGHHAGRGLNALYSDGSVQFLQGVRDPAAGDSMAAARKLADHNLSAARLRDCAKAAMIYAQNHNGKAPPDLATALSGASQPSSALTSPFGGEFTYLFPPGAPLNASDPTCIVAYDSAQLAGQQEKVNIVYADGHSDEKAPADARQEIDRFKRDVVPKLRAKIKP